MMRANLFLISTFCKELMFFSKNWEIKIYILSTEKEILGFDHAEIASGVCEKWQIPLH